MRRWNASLPLNSQENQCCAHVPAHYGHLAITQVMEGDKKAIFTAAAAANRAVEWLKAKQSAA